MKIAWLWICGFFFVPSLAFSTSPLDSQMTVLEEKQIPLSKVLLYSSGVGYFEHDGMVHGNGRLDLRFTIDQINDVLKSLVVQDGGGGQVSAVGYGSRDPIVKTLGSFGINLTANPTLGQLLNQIRGERIEVATPSAITGTIIGVEKKEQLTHADGRDVLVAVEYVNLLTEDGLRSIPLAQMQRIRLLSLALNGELQQALSVLATGHDAQKRTVSIAFEGTGSRPVHVAYIAEAPVWKTTYRLVLEDAHVPFLQGWAIVENSSEADWSDIRLSLVSGRPISFTMDLYQPLYATRPMVTPELYASLRPRVHGDALDDTPQESKQAALDENRMEMNKPARAQAKSGRRGISLSQEAGASAAPMPFTLQQEVSSAAHAQETGELFEYTMTTPVTIARHASAMLPIINQSMEGRKVSIYNSATHVKHPLNGFRLKNTSSLYLMQGPITVFDGQSYAGDARIEDLAPGQERLLSYALDLKTEVEPKAEAGQQELVNVSVKKGVLIATHMIREDHAYHIHNRDQKEKTILIEHPYRSDWQLIDPAKPSERTREVYRFSLPIEAGKAAVLHVREEKQLTQTVQLTDAGPETIMQYIRAKQISAGVKEALQRIVALRDRLSQTTARRSGLEQKIKDTTQEQTRIRENMSRLTQNSELYTRYVKKLDQQETDIEKLRKDIEGLKGVEEEQKRELNEFLLSMDLS
jgi:hypothetical protein